MTPKFPDERYNVILADPPWAYRDKCNSGNRGASHKYPTMTMRELYDLDVPSIAERDCVMAMWVTPPMLQEGLDLMAHYGFKFKTFLFLWVKTNRDGTPFRGMGHYTRANAEPCLLGIRGKGLPVLDHSVGQVILSPRLRHSEKPAEARTRIERLYGDVPRIELFARERVDGWTAWGNEISEEALV